MHDPRTLAFDVRNPFKKYDSLLRIWHVDPERDGSDDSCGWFMRSRHGDVDCLSRITKRYEREWDRVFTSDSKRAYLCGLFAPNGDPHFSVSGIVLNLFYWAAMEHFRSDGHTKWHKSRRWMQRNLFDILHFAENPVDSLHESLTRKFAIGCGEPYDADAREQMIRETASVVYGWILRSCRPWHRHPRWHFWHWEIQIPAMQSLKRMLFSRCATCGGRFKFGESVVTNTWDNTGPLWFRSERDIHHDRCSGCVTVANEQGA